jgi:hypothetical protein
MADQQKQMLTIAEAAAALDMSPKWIRKNIHGGSLKAIQDPADGRKTWLIDFDELVRWQWRELKARGRGEVRSRYVLSIETDEEVEAQLIEFVSALPNATLKRGHETDEYLVDTRVKEDS